MKTMKYFLIAICACFVTACTNDNADDPVGPIEESPTAKEKAMIPTEMIWQLDSVLVINYPGTLIETYEMLYAGQDTYQWTYMFYPCTYKFPDDLVFYSDFEGEAFQMSKEYNQDYCKYICTSNDEIVSAGYLCYYNDMFAFNGLQQGGWVEFMLREADTKWDSDVWISSYDSSVALDGTVEERTIEYYSRLRDSDERGGSASVKVDGTTFSVYNACWKADVLNGSDTFYTVQIANSDVFAGADPFDVVSIVYKVTNGSQTELATGEFANFDVSLTKIGSSVDKQYYAGSTLNGNNAKLKVTKSGGSYQIQFGPMKYTTDGSAGSPTYNGTAFSFTGAVKKGLLLQ
jgi:hypothetical protein